MTDGTRLSRIAIIYGANASGKSNLLEAFEYLFWFWRRKTDDQDSPTGVEPFILDSNTPSQPTEFELKLYVNDKKYVYQLILSPKAVLSEKLYVYNSNQPSLLIHRELVDGNTALKFNPSLIKVSAAVKDELTVKCLKNMSLFAARKAVNCNLGEIDDVRDWMINHTLPVIDLGQKMFNYAERKMLENPDTKKYLLIDEGAVRRLRESYQLPENCIVIGNVGRIVRHKGISFTVEIMNELKKRGKDTAFVVVGRSDEPDYVQEMIDKAESYGIAHRIILLGERSDIPIVMSSFDVFVGTALREGFGMVALEAQAAGVPCVLYRGFPKQVDMSLGIVNFQETYQPEKWANDIEKMLDVRKPNKEVIAERIKQCGFDSSKNAEIIYSLYNKLL